MFIVLVEDSGSGKIFIDTLLRFLGIKNYRIFDTSYGEKCKGAGNGGLFNAVNNLCKDKVLKSKDVLVLCYDNMINTGMNYSDVESLTRKLIDIERKCKKLGIELRLSDYTCFEELFLSYIRLTTITNYSASRYSSLDFERKVKNLSKMLIKTSTYEDRVKLYSKINTKGKGLEKWIAEVLGEATGNKNTSFRNWCITKGEFGVCWVGRDCRNNWCHKDIQKCLECEVFKKKISHSDLWNDLINNSNIRELCKIFKSR